MDILELIAERRIREAMERGEFDNLPLKGKPLPPDDLERVPPELRMAYKILKNANVLPEEIELRKSIHSLQELIRACCDGEEEKRLIKQLNEKQLRFNILMEKRFKRAVDPQYYARIMEKLR
jgi:hypothetical protein